MVNVNNLSFELNSFGTFVYSFKNGGLLIDEYIHGEVIEHLGAVINGSPQKVKIKQVNNLEAYRNKEEVVFTERVFNVSQLKLIINTKSQF